MEKHSFEKIYSIAVRTVKRLKHLSHGPLLLPLSSVSGKLLSGTSTLGGAAQKTRRCRGGGEGTPSSPSSQSRSFHSARGRLQVLIDPGFPLILQKLYLGQVWLKGRRFPSPTSPSEGRDTIPGVVVWEYWGPNCPCPRSVDVLCLGRDGQAEKGLPSPTPAPTCRGRVSLGRGRPLSLLPAPVQQSIEVLLRERGKLWTTLLEGTDYIWNRAWRIPGPRVFFKTTEILAEGN